MSTKIERPPVNTAMLETIGAKLVQSGRVGKELAVLQAIDAAAITAAAPALGNFVAGFRAKAKTLTDQIGNLLTNERLTPLDRVLSSHEAADRFAVEQRKRYDESLREWSNALTESENRINTALRIPRDPGESGYDSELRAVIRNAAPAERFKIANSDPAIRRAVARGAAAASGLTPQEVEGVRSAYLGEAVPEAVERQTELLAAERSARAAWKAFARFQTGELVATRSAAIPATD